MGKSRHTIAVSNSKEWADPSGGHWMVDMDWAVIDGRAECVGLTLRSFVPAGADGVRPVRKSGELRPLRTEVLRAFTMSTIEESRSDIVQPLGSDGLWPEEVGLRKTFTAGRARRLVGASGETLPPTEALAEVARIYTAAWQRGDPPTAAVAEALSISRSAAGKRVARARAAGLLPPSPGQGRARGAGVTS